MFTFNGEQPKRNLNAIAQRFGYRAAAALYRRGEAIKTDAQEHYVPIDLGILKNDIKVFPPEISATGRISVTIAAGTGMSRPYALAVHEHPSRYSPPSWRGRPIAFSPSGTGAKYLEKPLMIAVGTLARDLASDLALSKI